MRFIALLVTVCLCNSLFPQVLPTIGQQVRLKTTLQKEGLKGYVVELNQTIHEPGKDSAGIVKPGKRIDIYTENFTHFYNDTGNIEEEIEYKTENVVMFRRQYEYDALDRPLEESLLDGTDKVLSKYSYKYDMKGNLSERIVYKKNSKWSYTYDKAGNLTEEKGYTADGKLDSRIGYEYNANGVITAEITYTPEGKVNIKDEYTYDNLGNMVQKVHSIGTGITQTYNYIYQFDAAGNWIQKTEYKAGKAYRVYIRKFRYQVTGPAEKAAQK